MKPVRVLDAYFSIMSFSGFSATGAADYWVTSRFEGFLSLSCFVVFSWSFVVSKGLLFYACKVVVFSLMLMAC